MASILATLPALAWLAFLLAALVFVAAGAVFTRRLVLRIRGFLKGPSFSKRRTKIDNLLKGYDASLLDTLPPAKTDIRDYLVSMAENVEGDVNQRLLAIYRHQGYLEADLEDLDSRWQFKRVHAVARLRAFKYPLADKQWQKLMTSRQHWFRWAVMDYLVMVQGKNSFRWLALYLGGSLSIPQGNLMHLIARFGQAHAESLPFILEHWQDTDVRRAVLKTLSLYPVPGCAPAIRRSFHLMAPAEVTLVGLSALKVHPDPDNIEFLTQFVWHEDWRVRLHLVDALSSYPEAVELLAGLALDGCFEVRCQAASALVQLGPVAGNKIDEILAVAQHPSRILLATATAGRTYRVA